MDLKTAKFINKIKPFSNKERENLRKMAKNDERWTLNTSYDFDDEAITETIELGDKVLEESTEPGDEFCPKCYADLTMQRGYNRSLAYWMCLGCGAMLINPKIESDIVWVDVLTLSVYKEEAIYNGREDMIVVTHRETGE